MMTEKSEDDHVPCIRNPTRAWCPASDEGSLMSYSEHLIWDEMLLLHDISFGTWPWRFRAGISALEFLELSRKGNVFKFEYILFEYILRS